MAANDARTQLAKALKDLMTRWLETRASWDDSVASRFEREVLFPLEMDVKSAGSAIDDAAKVLHQVKRDCT